SVLKMVQWGRTPTANVETWDRTRLNLRYAKTQTQTKPLNLSQTVLRCVAFVRSRREFPSNFSDFINMKRSRPSRKEEQPSDVGDSALFQVRCFLQKRRAAKAPPTTPFWIGQNGLTDNRRVELKRQVEEYIALHPSTRVSPQECERLHEEVQLLLLSELQRGDHQRREEERMEALLAHTHTQLELLRGLTHTHTHTHTHTG
ncbi:Arf-GAP with GTPase, partial [Nibea albiflora]